LSLVGIEPSAFWNLLSRIEQVMADIADDPLGFASNLLAAIGAGFEQFFDNFVSHLFEGFIEWLFSGLGAMGIEIPSDFSLSSIITFFLQLMGITWDRIRELLAKHIGEENVALLEQAFEIISDLIELGPEGVFQLIEDQLDPAHILDTIIDMAVDYVVEALVEQATIRIIGLFNPVGAIVQAIEAIYRVFKWIFENAARIFTLVESVVNGMADIIAGNIAGMAATVENALARLLVPVIDFVAEFLHLGELPEKVADAVRGLQNWVEGILDRVIGWLANQARGILSALGLTEDGEQEEGGEEGTLEDTEVGESVAFSGGGEQHRIWIRESGDQLELMVASDDPMPLRERLAGWRQTATSLPQETKTEAERLIGVVQSQYNIVLEEGEDSQEAKETAQADPTPENIAAAQNEDGQVVREQREMTPELGQLFDLFEGGVAFSPTEESVSIGVGQLRVGIAESAEGRLEAQLEGQDVDRQMAVMEQGPIGTAQHVFGITLVREVSLQVSEVNEALNQVAVTNGKIPSASHRNLADWMGRLRNQIGRLSPTKARSFKHLTSSPPSPIDNFLVEFGQQLGTSQTITDEYDRQLGLQQAGLNQISIDQWIINRNAYKLQDSTFVNLDAEERRAVLMELQRRAADSRDRARGRRQRFIDAIAAIEEALEPVNLADPQYTPDFSNISLVTNRFGNERNWRGKRRQEVKDIMKELRTGANDWQTIFRRSAVLHNADQIAGGFGFIPDIARVPRPADNADQAEWDAYLEELSQFVGSANVNSSIGSLWQHKINGLEQHVRDNYPGPGWAIWKMNVTLRRV
ncbi:MAG: hypothetical protein KDC54_13890, partial [Lewinella sp.]|nr:hypothetical protein [Lewinella sp.]